MIETSSTPKMIPAEIVSNQEIAPAWFRMLLSGPLQDFRPQPGQFALLRLGDGCDPLLRRPFGIFRVERPSGVGVEILYQVVGKATHMMSRLLPGTRLELQGPLGNAYQIPPDLTTAFIVAGGIGIAPLRGLIRHLQTLKTSDLQVFLGVRSAPYLFVRTELKELGISFQIATDDGSEGFYGLVTDLFRQFLDNFDSSEKGRPTCFACGPTPMLKALAGICSRYGLSCQVSLEARMACGIGACLGCVVGLRRPALEADTPRYGRVCVEGPVFEAEEIVW